MKKALLIVIVALIGLAFSYSVRAGGAEYVGVKKCKACHSAQYKAWEKTKHATALETLKKAGKDRDAKCNKCHNTGVGKAQAKGAELSGVQCEACHGAGSNYRKPSIMSRSKFKADKPAAHAAAVKAGLVVPDEKLCKTCHNKKSPNFKPFDFAKRKEQIKHW